MRGGYRKGAGRKKGFAAKNAEEARRILSERVALEIAPISDALISQAKRGDIRAIHELFDRAWGRAPQAIQINGNDPILGVNISIREDAKPIYEGLSNAYEQVEK